MGHFLCMLPRKLRFYGCAGLRLEPKNTDFFHDYFNWLRLFFVMLNSNFWRTLWKKCLVITDVLNVILNGLGAIIWLRDVQTVGNGTSLKMLSGMIAK